MPNSELSLEKLKIHERLLLIEQYILEGKDQRAMLSDTLTKIEVRCKSAELMIHGDNVSLDKATRDGINRRIEALELIEKNGEKIKKGILNVSVGSITLAVGAAMIWLFDVFRQAFIKPH